MTAFTISGLSPSYQPNDRNCKAATQEREGPLSLVISELELHGLAIEGGERNEFFDEAMKARKTDVLNQGLARIRGHRR